VAAEAGAYARRHDNRHSATGAHRRRAGEQPSATIGVVPRARQGAIAGKPALTGWEPPGGRGPQGAGAEIEPPDGGERTF